MVTKLKPKKNVIVNVQQCIESWWMDGWREEGGGMATPPALSLARALFSSLPCSLTSRTSVFAHGIANQLRFCAPASRTHGRARPAAAHRWRARAEDTIPVPYWDRVFIFINIFFLIFNFFRKIVLSFTPWRRCLDLFLWTQLSYLRLTASWNPCWRTPWNCPFITMKV